MSLEALSFKVAFTILITLYFLVNFRLILSVSAYGKRKPAGILTGIVWSLNLGRIDIFTELELLRISKH